MWFARSGEILQKGLWEEAVQTGMSDDLLGYFEDIEMQEGRRVVYQPEDGTCEVNYRPRYWSRGDITVAPEVGWLDKAHLDY